MNLRHPFSQTVIPLVVFVFVLVLGVFWTVPTVSSLQADVNEIELLEEQLGALLIPKQNTLMNTREDELDGMLLTLGDMVPNEPLPAQALAIVEEISNKTGLETSKPSLVGIHNKDARSTVSIRLHGTSDEVTAFFGALNQTMPILRIGQYQSEIEGFEGEDGAEPIYEVFVEVDAPFEKATSVVTEIERAVLPVLPVEREIVDELQQRTDYTSLDVTESGSQGETGGKANPFSE